MKLDNLKVGNIYTYKSLTEILDLPYLAGNSKKKQLKILSQYIDYTKEGTKFIINEIYDNVIPSVKTIRSDSVYSKYIELLIINKLRENFSSDCYMSLKKWLEELSMVNQNYYNYMGFKKAKLYFIRQYEDYYDDLDLITLYDFFDFSYNKIYHIFFKTLNSMQKRGVISYGKEYLVETYSLINGEKKYNQENTYHIADDIEIYAIKKIEKKVSQKLNIKQDYLWKGMGLNNIGYNRMFKNEINKYYNEDFQFGFNYISKVVNIKKGVNFNQEEKMINKLIIKEIKDTDQDVANQDVICYSLYRLNEECAKGITQLAYGRLNKQINKLVVNKGIEEYKKEIKLDYWEDKFQKTYDLLIDKFIRLL